MATIKREVGADGKTQVSWAHFVNGEYTGDTCIGVVDDDGLPTMIMRHNPKGVLVAVAVGCNGVRTQARVDRLNQELDAAIDDMQPGFTVKAFGEGSVVCLVANSRWRVDISEFPVWVSIDKLIAQDQPFYRAQRPCPVTDVREKWVDYA